MSKQKEEKKPDQVVFDTKTQKYDASIKEYGTNVTIYDPWANKEEVMHEYNLTSTRKLPNQKFDAIVLTVSHHEFLDIDFSTIKNENSVVYDVKNILSTEVKNKTL